MKNAWDNLLRRSFDNHILAHRHNKREDEILEEKFSLYYRRVRVVDHHLYMCERRLEQHAKHDLGLVISYKEKPIEASENREFYYPSTKKNWTRKEYRVEPLDHVLQHQNVYEYVFERRSQKYIDELKQKKMLHKLRKENFMNKTESYIRDDYDRNNDWPTSDNARVKLPLIHKSKSNRSSKFQCPVEL